VRHYNLTIILLNIYEKTHGDYKRIEYNYVDTLIYNLDCLTWLLVDETDQKSQKRAAIQYSKD
jgi:hypothetical protein